MMYINQNFNYCNCYLQVQSIVWYFYYLSIKCMNVFPLKIVSDSIKSCQIRFIDR